MDQGRRSLTGTAFEAAARRARLPTLLTFAALLGGCPAPATRPSLPGPLPPAPPASQRTTPPSTAPSPPVTPAPRPPRPPRENHLSPATRALVAQARTQMSHGDFDGASATLDRALRIEPNNPLLWVERGRLRLAETDPRQAEVCARKALVLASGDRNTQAQAGRLLADALRAQHRDSDARAVESEPYMR